MVGNFCMSLNAENVKKKVMSFKTMKVTHDCKSYDEK